MYDVAIIGCGVIGASLSYTLSKYQLKVLILEQENDVAMGTTKANSAIVHAGYDPEPGTLMAKLNVQGSEMMEDLCRTLSVKYKRIGSFVLAFDEESCKHLEKLYENGVKNGVRDQKILTGDEARAMDPNLTKEVKAALYAPTAAVIDPWGLCIAEAEVAVKNGADLKLSSRVESMEVCKCGDQGEHLLLHTTIGDYEARYVVNCAGGWGHEVAEMADKAGCADSASDYAGPEWTPYPNRGEYYLLDKSMGSLVSHVIFQCPTAAGKGVLVAPTVHGNLIVGPNAEAVAGPYSRENTLSGLDAVASASRKSVNGIDLRQSIRNFAGVRANTSESDFIIRPARDCKLVLNIAGIKSPGLSAAPAIGEYAAEYLKTMGLTLTEKEAGTWNGTRTKVHFKDLSDAEKAELIKKNPRYGRVICRCETITEGEIIDAIHSPITPCSIDGIKRRAGSGMGRCQGGFCGPRVLDLLSKELGIDPLDVLQDGAGTKLLIGRTKSYAADAQCAAEACADGAAQAETQNAELNNK